MPLYEYQCLPQNHRFEVRHGFNEEPVSECPQCGGPVRRVIHPVGIVFKGSGFYATDSRKTGSAAEPGKSSSDSKGESKTESKAESKSESSTT
ncbi:MAG: hypothetical protein JOZ41_03365 [Chloroflexi bacterium]|nr:hypothetical protein [Chloroflexota bacterium]